MREPPDSFVQQGFSPMLPDYLRSKCYWTVFAPSPATLDHPGFW